MAPVGGCAGLITGSTETNASPNFPSAASATAVEARKVLRGEQAVWAGSRAAGRVPPPHRGAGLDVEASRRGLPWGPPQEGALPDLPTRPPPTLLSLSIQARRSSDRPVPPRIPKTPVFGPKKRDPGPGTPISRPQPLTLTAVPKSHSISHLQMGVCRAQGPPASLLGPCTPKSPGDPCSKRMGEPCPPSALTSCFGDQAKCTQAPGPSTPHQPAVDSPALSRRRRPPGLLVKAHKL